MRYFFSILTKAGRIFSRERDYLRKIPGLTRIYEILYFKSNPEGIIKVNFENNELYVNSRDIGVALSLIRYGIYEEFETQKFKELLCPDTVLIDIGANIGYYTIIASNIIKKGKIYAFEPEPNNFQLLVKNIKTNEINNAVALQNAVSEKTGQMKIYIDEKNLGNHSLSASNVKSNSNFIEIETITLDTFFEFDKTTNIVVKIDTQGAEGLVLKGATKFLRRSNVTIFMEFWPNGLTNMGTNPLNLLKNLEDLGYQIEVIDDQNKSLIKMNPDDILKLCDNLKNTDQLNILIKKRVKK